MRKDEPVDRVVGAQVTVRSVDCRMMSRSRSSRKLGDDKVWGVAPEIFRARDQPAAAHGRLCVHADSGATMRAVFGTWSIADVAGTMRTQHCLLLYVCISCRRD